MMKMPPDAKTRVHDDDLVMSLVEQTLTMPPPERRNYLRQACSGDLELFRQVWNYVEWEERMGGFLLEPICPIPDLEHPFEAGHRLDGRFRIEREIAQGGMGVVYEAWDEKLERRIAIKCAKAGFGKRLPPEVRHAREIGHPNVCKIFEIHTAQTASGKLDFVTMEYVDGETLAARLKREPPPPAEALSIARQICAGLSAAHARGVIHGDLKSHNVILARTADGSPRAVITDFGMARERESTQTTMQSGPRGGTPGYMAPELWKGEKATMASDVYALGVLFHEVLGGRKPASGKVVIGQPKWSAVVAKCLAADPAHRYASAAEVARALEPSRARRFLPLAAAAAILAAITGLITYERAAPPKEKVRLAVLPFAYSPDLAGQDERILGDASTNLVRLQGGAKVRYSAVPLASSQAARIDTADRARTRFQATHVLHGSLTREADRIVLHALVTDTRTGVNARDWTMDYSPGQIRYIPGALAGVVTGAFHLPPAAIPAIHAAARSDYEAGSVLLRHDATVDAAIASFERAVAADPDSPLAFAGLSDAQYEKYAFGNRDSSWLRRAAENEKEAERRNPDLPRVLFMSASLDTGNSRYDRAIAEFTRALEIDPKYADAYMRLGRVYELNGEPDRSLAALVQAAKVDPGYYRPYIELGRYQTRKYRYSEALAPLLRAVELAPAEPYARFSLASLYLDLGKFREAEAQLRIALDVQPTIAVLDTLGFVLMYQHREREAIAWFQRALAMDAADYYAWMHLGDCYRRLNLTGKSDEGYRAGLAVAELEKQKDPKRGRTRSYVAYFNARLGNRRSAASEISQALTLSSDGTEVLWMAVLTYEALGARDAVLSLLASAPPAFLADLNRWPDLAGLQQDPRFTRLLASRQVQ